MAVGCFGVLFRLVRRLVYLLWDFFDGGFFEFWK